MMSQAVDLRIIVDKESTEYSPGETIEGYIKVTLTQKMNARGIHLHFCGKSYTQVTEISRSLTSIRSNSIMFRETQYYLDTDIFIWGEGIRYLYQSYSA